MNATTLLILCGFLVGCGFLPAQRGSDALRVRLLDGADVHLYQQRQLDGPPTAYAYEPFNLRLSEHNGQGECSFLSYRPDSTEAISGGILHFLLTWGPTPAQRRELESLLWMRTDSSYYLAGSLLLENDPAAPQLEIGPPDHKLALLLKRSLNSVAFPPVNPGGKMAASFSFSPEDAQTMTEVLHDPKAWKGVYLGIRLKTMGRNYAPLPPSTFTLTTNFPPCLDSY